jgi:ribosome-dependent ATPase
VTRARRFNQPNSEFGRNFGKPNFVSASCTSASCGFGQLISTFTPTQVAAVFATVVLSVIPTVNFSGLITPVSSLTGAGRIIGLLFPAAWYQPISVGTFTKGLGYSDLWFNAFVLTVFALSYLIAAHIMLSKQES